MRNVARSRGRKGMDGYPLTISSTSTVLGSLAITKGSLLVNIIGVFGSHIP
jgi:hypothetical protein